MLMSRSVLSATRSLSQYVSSGVDHQTRTRIVFLHNGQPRTEFYAKQHAINAASLFYNIPNMLKPLIGGPLLVNNRIRSCIDEYGKRGSLEETLNNFAHQVESHLNSLLPEHGHLSCSHAFLFDEPSIEQELDKIMKSSTERVVFFPLHAHYSCSRTGSLLNAAAVHLQACTQPQTVGHRTDYEQRIFPGGTASFGISAIHRWNTHPTVANFWWELLQKRAGTYDAIAFAAPAMRGLGRTEYTRSVWSTCERIMNELNESVPWQLGFYNAWDDWQLPLRHSLSGQVKRLVGSDNNARRVAVVPVTHFIPTFDTFSILPHMLAKMGNVTLIEPDEASTVLTHGIAEVIKNHILGRPHSQMQLYCKGCFRNDCQVTKLLFAPELTR